MSRNSIAYLFIFTAIVEAGTGLLLLVNPSTVATLLLGTSPNTDVGLTVARLAGVALMALAIACWLARNDKQSIAVNGLILAMAVYNTGVLIVLVYAGTFLGLLGLGFWPVVIAHFVMAVWCVISLLSRST